MSKLSNPTLFRDNVRIKLQGILPNCTETAGVNMEKGIFNYTIKEATRRKIVKKWENPQFSILYKDRLRSIYINIKSSPTLCENLSSGEILPQNVAHMTHQEYNPTIWKELIEKKMKRDASKYTDNIQASTNMYTCRKCKSSRCTYYEMQTRSADEPATIFVTCLDCGKHWRS
jgi:transcription elongation factor S-II